MSSRGNVASTIDGKTRDEIRGMTDHQVRQLSPEAQAEWLTHGMGQIAMIVKDMNFSGVDFSNATLGTRGSGGEDASGRPIPSLGARSFINCTFEGANLDHAEAANASFEKCNLNEVEAPHAIFYNCVFQGTTMNDANLYASSFEKSFAYNSITLSANRIAPSGRVGAGLSLRDANLEGATFLQAGMEQVDFSGADLTNAAFGGVSPRGQLGAQDATIENADFSHAQMYNTTLPENPQNMQGANFDTASFSKP